MHIYIFTFKTVDVCAFFAYPQMSWFVPLGVRVPQVGNYWASVKVVMLSVQLHVFDIWVYDYFRVCEPVMTATCLYHLLQCVAPQGLSSVPRFQLCG